MKKHLSTFFLILIFLIGLSLLLYPTVSNLINEHNQSVAIVNYEEQVAKLDKKAYKQVMEAAKKYNEKIISNEFPANEDDVNGNDEYMSTLNIGGDGMIGYIKIDKIGVKLAIYHGISEPVLQVGVGHMPQTSLPIGGASTHAVLSGHRGLPSAQLFSKLDKLVVGDVFYIYVLDEILAYKVDQIKTVVPTDSSDLQIINGEDHVTLVTCTPYGINTHRLLVRGVRVSYESTIAESSKPDRNAIMINPNIVAPLLAFPVVFAFLVILIVQSVRIRKKAVFYEKRKKINRKRKNDMRKKQSQRKE